MGKLTDYTGDKYGRLTAVKEVGPYIPPSNSYRSRQYLFKCDCGNEIVAQITAVRIGNTRSCGCINKERIIKQNKKNAIYKGYSGHKHFKRWKGMIERCYYQKHKDYHNYGGRGIKVCDEWRSHPKLFIEWVENESNYRKGLTLDRLDVNGNYEPNNCTFSNHTTQVLNRNIMLTNTSGYPGVTKHTDNRWRARININKKRISLGVYDTKEAAIEARKNAEIETYGKVLYKK